MSRLKKSAIVILGIVISLAAAYWLYFNISPCGISPLSCGDYSSPDANRAAEIKTGPGPEDLVFDTSGPKSRLIVSCSDRREKSANGSFWGIETDSDRSFEFTVLPRSLIFQPHGIHIATHDSTQWLYAICHDRIDGVQIDRILRFRIEGDTLHQDTNYDLRDEKLKIPNDLHVLDDGSIYVTNFLKTTAFSEQLLTSLGKQTGDIAYYDGSGKWTIAADDLCYPNGIYVDENTNQIWFANGGCKEVVKYDITSPGILDMSTKLSTKASGVDIPIGDNLMVDKNGAMWTANHPCTLKFLDHAQDAAKHSPIQIFKIDPTTMNAELFYQNNGEIISAASTAIPVNDKLYIAQVFEPFVLAVDL